MPRESLRQMTTALPGVDAMPVGFCRANYSAFQALCKHEALAACALCTTSLENP